MNILAETLARALRSFRRRTPFKPFLVELANGGRILVEHPEALAFRGGTAVFISPRHEFTLFDHEGVADVKDVPAEPVKFIAKLFAEAKTRFQNWRAGRVNALGRAFTRPARQF
jgi:hypothetical protein